MLNTNKADMADFFINLHPDTLDRMIEKEKKMILEEFTNEVETRAKEIWETIINLACIRFAVYEHFCSDGTNQEKRDEEINEINNMIIFQSRKLTCLFKSTKILGDVK